MALTTAPGRDLVEDVRTEGDQEAGLGAQGVADGPGPGIVERPIERQRPAVERLRERRLAGAVQKDDDGDAPASREVILGLDRPVPVWPEVVAGTANGSISASQAAVQPPSTTSVWPVT